MSTSDGQTNNLDTVETGEVMECLRDLAPMALYYGTADADFPDTIATRLLERLLMLCAAQRGVLCLASPPSVRVAQSAPASSSLQRPRVLALHEIQEEEAIALFQTLQSADPAARMVMGTTSWVQAHVTILDSLQEVWFVLGWNASVEGSLSAVERGRTRLPFVVDTAAAVIVHALQGERIRSENPVRVQETAFQETERLIAELLATVGHEFRTPLTAIKGYTETLLLQEPRIAPEERRDFLLAIREAGDRLELLTDRLLEIAQLEAGAMAIDYAVVDVPSLARETITAAQKWVPEPLRDRMTFHLHLRNEVGDQTREVPPVKGDAHRIREVLEHLLENAIHFSPEGGRIDVIVRPVPHAQESSVQDQRRQTQLLLEVCVCDYGVGIPFEHLERIFERFHRVDTSLNREVYGLGLGLTICQHLVALHHGRIWAESCPDGGSAFHIWLPVEEPAPTI